MAEHPAFSHFLYFFSDWSSSSSVSVAFLLLCSPEESSITKGQSRTHLPAALDRIPKTDIAWHMFQQIQHRQNSKLWDFLVASLGGWEGLMHCKYSQQQYILKHNASSTKDKRNVSSGPYKSGWDKLLVEEFLLRLNISLPIPLMWWNTHISLLADSLGDISVAVCIANMSVLAGVVSIWSVCALKLRRRFTNLLGFSLFACVFLGTATALSRLLHGFWVGIGHPCFEHSPSTDHKTKTTK